MRSGGGNGRGLTTFHVHPVCIYIHVEVPVQVLFRGTLADLFDLQKTSASRPLPMFGLGRGFLW